MCTCVKPATHIYKEVHLAENKGQFALGIAMIGGNPGGDAFKGSTGG